MPQLSIGESGTADLDHGLPLGKGMHLDIEIIRKHLADAATAKHLQLFSIVASTNSVLRDLAAKGAPEGTTVIADAQTGDGSASPGSRRPT